MKKLLAVLAFLLVAGTQLQAAPMFTFDALARTRYEYHLNTYDLGLTNTDEKSFFRFKFSGGVLADFESFASLYLRMSNESRSYIYNGAGSSEYNINEFIVDNLVLSMPKVFGVFDVKVGRMDLNPLEYGEGFLIADGTPLDGSRTFYFNAAKVKYNGPKGSVELIGIYNRSVDDIMPIINPNTPDTPLNDSNESALIVYGKTATSSKIYWEPYYMFKNEEANPQAGRIEKSINTFGSYVKCDLDKVIFRGQLAAQLSNYLSSVSAGFGGYVFADIPVSILQPFSLGYIYLSGDNTNTTGAEGWDPLFSRSPWMSEVVFYLYRYESGIGYWTNLQMYKADLNIPVTPRIKLFLSCGMLFANNEIDKNTTVIPGLFGDGKTRGGIAIAKLSYNISKNFSAFALGEYFKPGDFYYDKADDSIFVRLEFNAKI